MCGQAWPLNGMNIQGAFHELNVKKLHHAMYIYATKESSISCDPQNPKHLCDYVEQNQVLADTRINQARPDRQPSLRYPKIVVDSSPSGQTIVVDHIDVSLLVVSPR